MNRAGGFTLVEIMVALVILSLISLAAFAGLHHLIRVRETQMAHHDHDAALSKAYAMISQDLFYAIAVKEQTDNIGFELEKNRLKFYRMITNSKGEMEPLEIEYRWTDHDITRISSGQTMVLVSELEDIKLFSMGQDHAWHEARALPQGDDLPLALRFTFIDQAMGGLAWAFELPH